MNAKIVKSIKELEKPNDDASTEEAFIIIDQLTATLNKTSGVGLAAPQIGIHKKVFITKCPAYTLATLDSRSVPVFRRNISHERHFVNAKILSLKDPVIFKGEGCLSFEGESVDTLRFNEVTIIDSFTPEPRTFTGLEAVVIQHEYDHTMGITMHSRKLNQIGANVSCPCMSGKKYKKCCQGILKPFTMKSEVLYD